jgi:hypothetical protein
MKLKDIRPGMLVRSRYSNETFMVTASYGTRLTAVRTQDVTNPHEWDVATEGTSQYPVFERVEP